MVQSAQWILKKRNFDKPTEALRRLSRQVVTQLELRRALLEMDQAIKTRDEMYTQLQNEREKSDTLMAKILPKNIAEEIKTNGKVEPKYFDEASIMFCDLVRFHETD